MIATSRTFADLYREHHRAVFAVAARVAGDASASDVTQDVFVRLWSRPDMFDSARGSMRTFLLMLTRSFAIDGIRSEGARSRRESRVGPTYTGEAVDPADEAVTDETKARVESALAALPTKNRDPIVLAFFGGLSYRDVATALAAPEGTVKSRIRTGLQLLRAQLVES